MDIVTYRPRKLGEEVVIKESRKCVYFLYMEFKLRGQHREQVLQVDFVARGSITCNATAIDLCCLHWRCSWRCVVYEICQRGEAREFWATIWRWEVLLLKERRFVQKTGVDFKKEVIECQDVNEFCSLCWLYQWGKVLKSALV